MVLQSSPERSEGEVASRSEVGGGGAGASGWGAVHGGQPFSCCATPPPCSAWSPSPWTGRMGL